MTQALTFNDVTLTPGPAPCGAFSCPSAQGISLHCAVSLCVVG